MKIFIWEGNRISSAYHDDGTLVVLAETPEQAREIVRSSVSERDAQQKAWERERDQLRAKLGWTTHFWKTPEGRELWDRRPDETPQFDGEEKALDREPDRIVDLDVPCVVAFNGGGYD